MDKKDKKVIKAAVSRRIVELLHEAHSSFRTHPERSRRYISLLWKLLEKYKVRLTREQKLSFCKKCFSPWIPGRSVQVHFDQRHHRLIYTCGKCGFARKMLYK